MPSRRQRVTKRVNGAIGRRSEASANYEKNATGAKRKHRLAVAHNADANGARRIVAAATGDRHLQTARTRCVLQRSSLVVANLSRSPALRKRRAQSAGRLAALAHNWHLIARQTARGEHRLAPFASLNVKPKCAG